MSFEGIILNRPFVDTFDSGYEHSLEHLADLREMLTEETEIKASAADAKNVAVATSAA